MTALLAVDSGQPWMAERVARSDAALATRGLAEKRDDADVIWADLDVATGVGDAEVASIDDHGLHSGTRLIAGRAKRAWHAEEFGGIVSVDDGVVEARIAHTYVQRLAPRSIER